MVSLPVPGQLRTLAVLARTGVLGPTRPDKVPRELYQLWRWGPTMAAAWSINAIRCPDEIALIDDEARLTFREVDSQSTALAAGLAAEGLAEGESIGILCRNGRRFVQAVLAASKLGCHALLLNTSFAGPQLGGVIERERPAALIHDTEFEQMVAEACDERLLRIVADGTGRRSIAALIAGGGGASPSPPSEPGRTVILTSGTTGTPKGANRPRPSSALTPLAAMLSIVPYRMRETFLLSPPLFHAHAYGQFEIGSSLGATFVLPSRFDPLHTLELIEREGVTSAPMVPVMLKRLLDLNPADRRRFDLSSLKVVLSSGSALPAELATRFMDEFADVLYNLYGSTEVAWATIASPRDMREAPGTAGRAPLGTRLEILDDDDRPLPVGQTGRIFVGHDMLFEGYTDDSSTKTLVRGLMSPGDLGHVDPEGRLFVDSREDDMIVSGGENVYPGEVEELLGAHPAVSEAAVIGVEDEEFGQRLQAHVVLSEGATVTEAQLREHVKAHLARYKVPREVVFHDELPRNAIGKVVKRELSKEV